MQNNTRIGHTQERLNVRITQQKVWAVENSKQELNQDVLTALGQIYILNCHFEVVAANVIVVAGVVVGAKRGKKRRPL